MSEQNEANEDKSMLDGIETISAGAARSTKEAASVIARLFDVAKPDAIFGDPVTQGEYSVITASELAVGVGLGFGTGEGKSEAGEVAGGGGGGGGGASMGRPVATIIIGPNGAHMEPIVDVTKIAIAMFTTIGAMFVSWRAIRRAAR